MKYWLVAKLLKCIDGKKRWKLLFIMQEKMNLKVLEKRVEFEQLIWAFFFVITINFISHVWWKLADGSNINSLRIYS